MWNAITLLFLSHYTGDNSFVDSLTTVGVLSFMVLYTLAYFLHWCFRFLPFHSSFLSRIFGYFVSFFALLSGSFLFLSPQSSSPVRHAVYPSLCVPSAMDATSAKTRTLLFDSNALSGLSQHLGKFLPHDCRNLSKDCFLWLSYFNKTLVRVNARNITPVYFCFIS